VLADVDSTPTKVSYADARVSVFGFCVAATLAVAMS
jgi:hypothetical protein